ncbi:MAG: TonB family protein [Flavobacteriales bacterium]|nr:TonB family protein [Flavobacteriales bacterium]
MMEKKNPNPVQRDANKSLERKKPLFFLIGLGIAILSSFVLINLEFEKKTQNIEQIGMIEGQELQYSTIEIFKVDKPKEFVKPPKNLKKTFEINHDELKIVKNQLEIQDENYLESDDEEEDETLYIDDDVDEEETGEVAFIAVESLPYFSSCSKGNRTEKRLCVERQINLHIKKNFKFPRQEKMLGISGKVTAQFVINKQGKIQDVQIVRGGKQKGFVKETKRLLNSIPQMIPGKQRGKPVNVKYTIPINFHLK